MPPRLSDTKRAAILADIRAGKPRNQIARDHKVSPSTVTGIANKGVGATAFDRSLTKNATEAAVADNRARRAETSRRFLDKANEFLDQMDQPYTVFAFGGKDNSYNEHTLDRPPIPELRNLMVASATAFDKHLLADRHDSGERVESAKSLIGAIAAGLNAAYDQLDTPSDDDQP